MIIIVIMIIIGIYISPFPELKGASHRCCIHFQQWCVDIVMLL